MLDIRMLNALREIALRGSFAAAAEQLNYSQSAISQQVAQLERQVGTLLIDRRGRGVELTPAGRRLVERTDTILRHLAEAEAELKAITGGQPGAVRVVAFGSAIATWMPSAIIRFRARHPDALVTLTAAESDAALDLIASGQADIAIVNRSTALTLDAAMVMTDLFDDPMRIALPVGHRLAGAGSVNLAELAEESWLVATSASCTDWEIFAIACRQAGFEPRIAYRNEDYLTLQGFVAAGIGVALLPGLISSGSVRDDIVVLPLGPEEPVRKVAAATISGINQAPIVGDMLEELSRSAAGLQAVRA